MGDRVVLHSKEPARLLTLRMLGAVDRANERVCFGPRQLVPNLGIGSSSVCQSLFGGQRRSSRTLGACLPKSDVQQGGMRRSNIPMRKAAGITGRRIDEVLALARQCIRVFLSRRLRQTRWQIRRTQELFFLDCWSCIECSSLTCDPGVCCELVPGMLFALRDMALGESTCERILYWLKGVTNHLLLVFTIIICSLE